MLQDSLLPFRKGRQLNVVVVGWLPKRTNRAASPVAPDRLTLSAVLPAGTVTEKCLKTLALPDWPVWLVSVVGVVFEIWLMKPSSADTRAYMPGNLAWAQPSP